MTYDSHPNDQDRLMITDKAFQDLYLSEYANFQGSERGGACMENASRVVRYFETQGIPKEKLQFLYIYAPTPGGPDVIVPNVSTLRAEEQAKAKNKEGKVKWSYHTAVMYRDTKQVFDLSSSKELWGTKLDSYMAKSFLNERGFGNSNLRFIVSTVDSLEEMILQDASVEIEELVRRGERDGGGRSSIWMLQNKPEEDWYWKNYS